VALVVKKFGGTSVGNLERMRNVSELALRSQREGNQVVLIVSAMSGETNRLLALAHQISSTPDMRELDSLASTGEQVSAALVAMTIHSLGGRAKSFLGHQVRINTDAAYTKARIHTIEGSKLISAVQAGNIAVVAGFQRTAECAQTLGALADRSRVDGNVARGEGLAGDAHLVLYCGEPRLGVL